VRILPFIPRGRGVIPDYTVKETPESFLRNHDTVLDFTLQLIKKTPSQLKK